MHMQRDMEQRIYFKGYFYESEELDYYIESLEKVVAFLQIETPDVEDDEEFGYELNIIKDLLELFSGVKRE
jgi:hypothetical protein